VFVGLHECLEDGEALLGDGVQCGLGAHAQHLGPVQSERCEPRASRSRWPTSRGGSSMTTATMHRKIDQS
jgi:hypothetical protein